jgi:hypothetical protein
MKKLIVVLIMVLVLFACQKETEYITVSVNNITENGVIYYTVFNQSLYLIKCSVVFKLDAENTKRFETEAFYVDGFKKTPRMETLNQTVKYAEVVKINIHK